MENVDNNKSVLEESLIDYNAIVKLVGKSSVGIVKDTLTEKLAQGLKNIITEADDFEEEDSVEGQDNKGLDDADSEPEDNSQSEDKPEEMDADLDGESGEDTSSSEGDGMEPEVGEEPEEGGEEDFDFDKFKTGEDEYDLTNSSIEDVIKVFKKIDDNDSIVVRNLENGKVELVDNETGADYLIDMGGSGEGDEDQIQIEFDENDGMAESQDEEPDSTDGMGDLAEQVSEIELEGAEDQVDEKNMTQSIGTNRRAGRMTQTRQEYAPGENNRDGAKLIANESKKLASIYMSKVKKIEEAYAAKFQEINEEVEKYKNALDLFRNKLKEQAVLNNNLAKYVKLVTENATSKDEKLVFLKRFSEEADTIEAGNRLFESIQNEIKTKGVGTFTINNNGTGTIQGTITESKNINEQVIYQSKDLQDTIGLINRMSKL